MQSCRCRLRASVNAHIKLQKGDFSYFEHGMVVGVFQKLYISWDFHTQQTMKFTQNGVAEKKIQ